MATRTGLAYLLTLAVGSVCWAADPVIHVAWEETPPPVQDVHYEIITSSPASPEFPDVRLLHGSHTWRVWSTDTDNPNDIGDIGVISCPAAANFTVTLLDDSDGPGARHCKGIVLAPTNSNNYSNLNGGKLSGDLDGDLYLQPNFAAPGGELTEWLYIAGDATGNISVHKASASIIIAGDLSGSIHTNILGDGTGSVMLWIKEDVCGNVTIEETLDNAVFLIGGGVSKGVEITIYQMFGAILSFGDTEKAASLFEGSLVLQTGISYPSIIWIQSTFQAPGTIDLEGNAIEGTLTIATGDGSIINGGALWGDLGLTDGGVGHRFVGRAELASVEYSGDIHLVGLLDGDIVVEGNVDGFIHLNSTMRYGSSILIGGESSGAIEVYGAMNGDIGISGDHSGLIDIGQSLGSTGRILIDGACAGGITIGRDTSSTSLIRAVGGLTSAASIIINDDAGDYDANGTIHIGALETGETLEPVTFDGAICIKDYGTTGGDLNGTIRVVGCHATTDALNICIGGSNNGSVIIDQSGCTNQVTWTCSVPCDG